MTSPAGPGPDHPEPDHPEPDHPGPDARLARWWADQSGTTRARLLAVPAGQTIPPALAWSLGEAGFPARPLGQGAYGQPPELTEFLAAVRRSAD